ncbi:MAG: DUF1223 domain-containing protein [Planctomycetes bacterium]|nr:DUF1223 domain-containing protein [Planctomycetota bacterium]
MAVLVSCGFEPTQRFAFAEPSQPPAGPVVVELFTSQGCSSCPPADLVLTEIAAFGDKHQLPIYCLSYHVDFWNSLGWKDPYSSPVFTKRQHRYAAAFGSSRVYTPQMIVNGETELLGSRGRDAKRILQKALATQATSAVELTAVLSSDKSSGEIKYTVIGNGPDMLLQVALVQRAAANKVPRGENAGRELTHVRVVRSLKTVPLETPQGKPSRGKLSIALPTGIEVQDVSFVAYVQDRRSMQITGASVATFKTP